MNTSFALAPLAGYTDAAFRSICIDWGADVCFTEMVSAEALTRNSTKTEKLLSRFPNELQYVIQLFGSKPSTLAKATKLIHAFHPCQININAGCPVPKIIKSGAGAALMQTKGLIGKIITAMRQETDIPIGVKFRSGWDAQNVSYLEFAEEALSAGATILCLHPRTKSQGYSGTSNWDHIKSLKETTGAFVFGSGDLFTAQSGIDMINYTHCDGILFARGALGNPFIFSDIKRLLKMPYKEIIDHSKFASIFSHLQLLIKQEENEKHACILFRKHFCSYTKGIHRGAELRSLAIKAESTIDYLKIMNSLYAKESG